MELILIKEDLLEVIQEPVKKENPQWVKRDGQALMVEEDRFFHLREADTAKKCLENLKTYH